MKLELGQLTSLEFQGYHLEGYITNINIKYLQAPHAPFGAELTFDFKATSVYQDDGSGVLKVDNKEPVSFIDNLLNKMV